MKYVGAEVGFALALIEYHAIRELAVSDLGPSGIKFADKVLARLAAIRGHFVTLCSFCPKVESVGSAEEPENAGLSHGICAKCLERRYPVTTAEALQTRLTALRLIMAEGYAPNAPEEAYWLARGAEREAQDVEAHLNPRIAETGCPLDCQVCRGVTVIPQGEFIYEEGNK